jgi:major membrane immunogen (membrane-anchored lipoprotein)
MSVNQVEEFIDVDQLNDAQHAGKPPVQALSQRLPSVGAVKKQAAAQTHAVSGATTVSKLSVDQVIANVLKKAK